MSESGISVSVLGGPAGSVVSVTSGSTGVVSGNVVAIVLDLSVDIDSSGDHVVGGCVGG